MEHARCGRFPFARLEGFPGGAPPVSAPRPLAAEQLPVRGTGQGIRRFRLREYDKTRCPRMESALRNFFALIQGKSPFDIERTGKRLNYSCCRWQGFSKLTAPSSRDSGILLTRFWTFRHMTCSKTVEDGLRCRRNVEAGAVQPVTGELLFGTKGFAPLGQLRKF
jgi:hypothetical protein